MEFDIVDLQDSVNVKLLPKTMPVIYMSSKVRFDFNTNDKFM